MKMESSKNFFGELYDISGLLLLLFSNKIFYHLEAISLSKIQKSNLWLT